MTKVFNTHIEAARYLLEKPNVNKVKSNCGETLRAGLYAEFIDSDGYITIINDFTLPFTAVEPEKDMSNQVYAKEIYILSQQNYWRDAFERIFIIMDEKIKKAKDE